MTTAVMIDGQLVDPQSASVSVFDRGFLYGDSVFETVRTYGGKPFALGEHLARLQRSAELVYIPMPAPPDQLAREVWACLRAANNPESYIRVMVTRGQGSLGLDPALADVPRRVLLVSELVPPAPRAYARGVGAVTFKTQRASDATDAEGAKIGNYLVAVLATRAAKESGAHEALIVNREGGVVEGATSNLFFVADGCLCTPPLSAGILPGVTRDRALQAAHRSSIEVKMRTPSVAQLTTAQEVFISSSIRELLPIVRIDQVAIAGGQVGAVTQRVQQGFRALIEEEMRAVVAPDVGA